MAEPGSCRELEKGSEALRRCAAERISAVSEEPGLVARLHVCTSTSDAAEKSAASILGRGGRRETRVRDWMTAEVSSISPC